MFLSEDGELYSCGLDNLQDPSDVLYSERLYPEKVNNLYFAYLFFIEINFHVYRYVNFKTKLLLMWPQALIMC